MQKWDANIVPKARRTPMSTRILRTTVAWIQPPLSRRWSTPMQGRARAKYAAIPNATLGHIIQIIQNWLFYFILFVSPANSHSNRRPQRAMKRTVNCMWTETCRQLIWVHAQRPPRKVAFPLRPMRNPWLFCRTEKKKTNSALHQPQQQPRRWIICTYELQAISTSVIYVLYILKHIPQTPLYLLTNIYLYNSIRNLRKLQNKRVKNITLDEKEAKYWVHRARGRREYIHYIKWILFYFRSADFRHRVVK